MNLPVSDMTLCLRGGLAVEIRASAQPATKWATMLRHQIVLLNSAEFISLPQVVSRKEEGGGATDERGLISEAEEGRRKKRDEGGGTGKEV